MKTFTITFLYVFMFALPWAIPATYKPQPNQISQTDLRSWVCKYNVGPNADLKDEKVQRKCLSYAAKVEAHMRSLLRQ